MVVALEFTRTLMMKKLALGGLWLSLAISGCSSKGGLEDNNAGASIAGRRGAVKAGGGGHAYSGADRNAQSTGLGDLDSATGPLSKRVIYFAYDSDDVLPEYEPVLTAHAEYLASHAGLTVVLEGHADERGSSEYNIALSERRAQSVARSMRLQGAGDNQLQIVSYGEEKPAVSGHEESSWQQNRRVEIIYSGH
jgi:peptidoglycan-associated lipoprotein